MPTVDGLDKLAAEARACSEVNYVGTVLALGTFVSPECRDYPVLTVWSMMDEVAADMMM